MARQTPHDFTYNTKSKRYHNTTTGKFVGRVEVRNELDKIIEVASNNIKLFTREMQTGNSSIAEWQINMVEELKPLHMVMVSAANGGWNNTTDKEWQRLSTRLESEFNYLQEFAKEIYTGEAKPGTYVSRAMMYAEGARVTYENEKREIEIASGSTEERNILGGSDHCDDCITATNQGWVTIGTLIPIGNRQCVSRCKCVMIYRTGPSDKVGSEEN